MRYAITIALMLGMSFGLITESFRYQSTARLFEDDYDLLFDPGRIPEIEGSRLWTSLANLVSGSEELFSDGSQPYVLLGGVTGLNNFYPALVYDRSSDKNPLNTGLFDPYGNPIYGDGTVTEIDWDNPDTLGNYQSREVTTQTRHAYDIDGWSDYFFGLATKRNAVRFGLGYLHRSYKGTYTDPANNYEYYYFTEDLVGDSLTYSDSALYAGDEIMKASNNEIIFSAWMDKEKLDFGFTGRFELIGQTDEAVINGYEIEYQNPNEPNHYYTTTSVLDSSMLPQSGSRIDVDLKAFYDYTEFAQGRFYVGFFTRNTSYGDEATAYYWEDSETEIDPIIISDNTTTESTYDGSFGSIGFRVGTKHLFQFSDNVKFGIGLLWSSSSVNDSTTTVSMTDITHAFDDGDTIPLMDTVITQTSGETWVMTRSGSVNSFIIPVGVEFNIAKPIVFRLGANHTITTQDLTTNNILADWDPQVTHIQIDTIDIYYYQDPGERPEDTEENDALTSATTNYYYGLGWRVTKNLQLDFMGFSDIVDWQNWRLSATFHFGH